MVFAKTDLKIPFFSRLRTFTLTFLSAGSTRMEPGYERMSKQLAVNFTKRLVKWLSYEILYLKEPPSQWLSTAL